MNVSKYMADKIEEESRREGHSEYKRAYMSRLAAGIREDDVRTRKDSVLTPLLKEVGAEYTAYFLSRFGYGAMIVAASALLGELADNFPYIRTAIPHVMQEVTGSNYFYGNLDKLGATLGFFAACTKRGRRG